MYFSFILIFNLLSSVRIKIRWRILSVVFGMCLWKIPTQSNGWLWFHVQVQLGLDSNSFIIVVRNDVHLAACTLAFSRKCHSISDEVCVSMSGWHMFDLFSRTKKLVRRNVNSGLGSLFKCNVPSLIDAPPCARHTPRRLKWNICHEHTCSSYDENTFGNCTAGWPEINR